jgi:GDP/UDP-N,N'-diacetylbacillosamine 2-epimerase (hydrolysing)
MPTKKKRIRKIAIVTGGRIEFGYVRPVIKAIEKNPDLDYEIIAANMHVLPEFGHTVDEIYRDKFKVGAAVHNTLAGYTHLTMVKSLGVFLTELPGIIERMAPDFILVAGDRGEPLVAAMTGAHMYIPVAHIQAGELSGNIDGMTRHAITKYAHIHFAANDDAAKRLKKMGEQDFRILNVGAPQLDEFVSGDVTDSKTILQRYHLPRNKKSILLIQHSVTEEADLAEKQIAESIKAVASLKLPTVIILNNSDAGSRHIREVIARYKNFKARTFNHIPRPDYFGLLKTCDVLVGNSSSGIIEAPLAKIPVVNIGNRQKGRLQSTNVINVGHSQRAIAKAIKRALSDKFRARAEKSPSVYGDGHSAEKIVDLLATTPIDKKLLVKELTY